MPGWLSWNLMERSITDAIHDLSTFASRQITTRDMCRKQDYPADGFNPVKNQVSEH